MRNDRGGRLVDNEQFFLTLGRLAAQSGEPAEAWIKGFAWAADQVMVDDLPRFNVFDGCSAIGGGGRCYNEARLRAVYDTQTEKLYLIRATGTPECRYAWQHINNPEGLAGSTFLPPQQEWPGEALDALKRSYCGPS